MKAWIKDNKLHIKVQSERVPENIGAVIHRASEELNVPLCEEVVVILDGMKSVRCYIKQGKVFRIEKWGGWPAEEIEEDERPQGWAYAAR